MMYDSKIEVRLPKELKAALEAKAKSQYRKLSDVFREQLIAWLKRDSAPIIPTRQTASKVARKGTRSR